MSKVWLALAILVLSSGSAAAATRRFALIIGNDLGNRDRPALHYAARDAERVADVLTELASVAHDDVTLLTNAKRDDIQRALDTLKQTILERRKRGDDVVLFVYFSGHSDGVALEVAGDSIEFADLRQWMRETRANVRVAIVDSCKSGALLASKGVKTTRGFHIRFANQLATVGEAVLTSSAADELALESSTVGGSFFTHHFISGLRGAADTSGDHRVTLSEAYRYAYDRTTLTTDATLPGPQHPTYDYRMSGEGELVLTDLTTTSDAQVNIRAPFDRVVIADGKGLIVAELTRGAASSVDVPAGAYRIQVTSGAMHYETGAEVAPKQTFVVNQADLLPVSQLRTASKGDVVAIVDTEPQARDDSPWRLALFGGLRRGSDTAVGAAPGGRLEVDYAEPFGLGLALDMTTSTAQDMGVTYRETNMLAWVGPRWRHSFGMTELQLGIDVGGGRIAQTAAGVATHATGAIGGAPSVRFGVQLVSWLDLVVSGQLPVLAARRDDHTVALFLPAAWLGFAAAF